MHTAVQVHHTRNQSLLGHHVELLPSNLSFSVVGNVLGFHQYGKIGAALPYTTTGSWVTFYVT